MDLFQFLGLVTAVSCSHGPQCHTLWMVFTARLTYKAQYRLASGVGVKKAGIPTKTFPNEGVKSYSSHVRGPKSWAGCAYPHVGVEREREDLKAFGEFPEEFAQSCF